MRSSVFVLWNYRTGLTLMERRPDLDSHFPNEWLFPGGKLEGTEAPEQALVREAQEELHVVPLVFTSLESPDKPIYYARAQQESHRLHPYLVMGWEQQDGEIAARVHDSGNLLEWRSPLAALYSPIECTRRIARAAIDAVLERQP